MHLSNTLALGTHLRNHNLQPNYTRGFQFFYGLFGRKGSCSSRNGGGSRNHQDKKKSKDGHSGHSHRSHDWGDGSNSKRNRAVRQLSSSDCSQRFMFAQHMLKLIEQDPTFLHSILFTSESYLWPVKHKTDDRREKLQPTIAWCGMTSREIIGPYFYHSPVTGKTYIQMLESYMIPELLYRRFPLETFWFQFSSLAENRKSQSVQRLLRKMFQGRVISPGSAGIAWPPSSKDLSPTSYFLWKTIKEKIAQQPPKKSSLLRARIINEVEAISVYPKTLENAVLEFKTRLEKCVSVCGQRFGEI